MQATQLLHIVLSIDYRYKKKKAPNPSNLCRLFSLTVEASQTSRIIATSFTVMQLRQMQIIPALIVTVSLCTVIPASVAMPIQRNGYELIFGTDRTTGSVTLTCRDALSANDINVNSTNYFLNSSEYATDLRQREDFCNVEIVGCCSIKFNLPQNLEGNYTCGTRINDTLQESPPKTLICEYNLHTIASYM